MNEVTQGSETEFGRKVLGANDITKTYGSRLPFTRSVEVLTGASIDVYSGGIVGIVGENGSGKSTLMKILVGALEQDSGDVSRNGTIGWCPQETLLYDRLTVRETCRLFGTGYGLDVEEVTAAMNHLANRLDFERYLDYRIDRLSGGNDRSPRTVLARLVRHPILFVRIFSKRSVLRRIYAAATDQWEFSESHPTVRITHP